MRPFTFLARLLMPKNKRAPQPLRCHKCNSRDITVSGAQQMLSVGGKKMLHARVTCAQGHEWYSRHPEALKLSRQVDKNRVVGANGPHLGQ